MPYDNSAVRRQDRLLDEARARELLAGGRFGVLSAYESIVLDCRARRGLPPGERMRALELLLEKYSPAHKTTGLRYAEASFARTEIVRLDVVAWSGKTKRVH